MSLRFRIALLALAGLALLPGAAEVIAGLPPFGSTIAQYGERINAITPEARHVANMVSAINFDLRGLDTLGEEFMLLAAITGTVVLLRGRRGEGNTERAMRRPGRAVIPRSEAVVLACRIAGPLTALFGLYVVLHATVTPGGGFQGGVILASAPLVVYLSGDAETFERIVSSPLIKLAESGGAAGYAIIGAVALLFGAHFLTNIIPLGMTGDLFSSETIAVISATVGVEVTGGFVLLMKTYLQEIIVAHGGKK